MYIIFGANLPYFDVCFPFALLFYKNFLPYSIIANNISSTSENKFLVSHTLVKKELFPHSCIIYSPNIDFVFVVPPVMEHILPESARQRIYQPHSRLTFTSPSRIPNLAENMLPVIPGGAMVQLLEFLCVIGRRIKAAVSRDGCDRRGGIRQQHIRALHETVF